MISTKNERLFVTKWATKQRRRLKCFYHQQGKGGFVGVGLCIADASAGTMTAVLKPMQKWVLSSEIWE